ncbi:MAG: co-chaperone YbbN [Betaproteobacteria bacterium]|nr:co-chaperone YbbN [Betaproteobacteria bacterium]
MSPHSFDVDAANFQQQVMEASQHTPVVVDFWAEWCGPCKALKPILEKLAAEYEGKFLLAKVNSDQNQELAAQFGVRGIPNVKAVYQGRIVDEFSGALPESAVREFLDRLIPSPADELRAQAAQQKAAGDLAGAMQTLAAASNLDISNEDVRIDAAEVLLELNEADEARRLLDSLSADNKASSRVQQLLAKLAFAGSGADSGAADALRARIGADANDHQARYDLANLLVGQGQPAAGLDELLEIVHRDRTWNEDAARKQILAVFTLLGGQGEVVSTYRRKLASALN